MIFAFPLIWFALFISIIWYLCGSDNSSHFVTRLLGGIIALPIAAIISLSVTFILFDLYVLMHFFWLPIIFCFVILLFTYIGHTVRLGR